MVNSLQLIMTSHGRQGGHGQDGPKEDPLQSIHILAACAEGRVHVHNCAEEDNAVNMRTCALNSLSHLCCSSLKQSLP